MRTEMRARLGINNCFRATMKAGAGCNGADDQPMLAEGAAVTAMEWEILPDGLRRLLVRVQRDYAPSAIYITENGVSFGDGPGPDGRVHDQRRIDFYKGYIGQVVHALDDGADVRGYYAWSLLDNFEWAFGFSQRFGIIHCDFENGQKRTIKDSGYWYRDLIARGLAAPRLVVADVAPGLISAVEEI